MVATDQSSKDLLLKFLDMDDDTWWLINSFIEVGGALYSMGINLHVARTLICNPSRYAALMTLVPASDPEFKRTANMRDLLPLLVPKESRTIYDIGKQCSTDLPVTASR